MTTEECEEKAQHCLRLIEDCADPHMIAVLEKLAEEYTALAAALRNKKSEIGRTGAEAC
jgi:hypothetical protein